MSARSITDITRSVVHDFRTLLHSEVRLAKAEVNEEADKAALAARFSAAGAVLGVYALGLFILALLRALDGVMRPWLAALLCGAAIGAAAFALFSTGRTRFKQVNAKPVKTVRSIRESIQWIKNRIA